MDFFIIEGFNLEILIIMLGYAIFNGLGSLLFKIHYRDHEFDDQRSLLTLDKNLPQTLWKLIKDWKWTLGAILLVSDFVIYQFALSKYEISIVKPLVNLNLIFVITFGVVILKEKISKKEIIAIFCIAFGSIIISLYSVQEETIPNLLALSIFAIIIFSTVFLGVCIQKRKEGKKNHEYFVSVFCGTLYGLGSIFNKAMYQNIYSPPLLYFTIFAILFGISYFFAFIFGQFAYSEGRMAMVSTIVNVISILIPFIGGVLIFNEELLILFEDRYTFPNSYVKIFGLVLIIIGVLLAYKNDTKARLNKKT